MGCAASDENRVVTEAEYAKAVISLESFKFERTLGKGGFGKVNACTFNVTQKWFAMKTMKKLTVLEKNGLEMLYNERDLLMKLDNPWLVNAFGAFQDATNVYLLMDLCLGGDLSYHLSSDKTPTFSESRCKFYTASIIMALKYLHSQNILHRDIKPANLLLDHHGYVKVTDLGISTIMKDGRCKSCSGTKAYMSPEMLQGDHDHGPCADFYALGITLYQMMAGKRPSSDLSLEENIAKLGTASEECKRFIKASLEPEEQRRIGYSNGADELLKHPWFNNLNLVELEDRTILPEFMPDITRANCHTSPDDLSAFFLPPPPEDPLSEEQNKPFKEYSNFGGDRKRMFESGKTIPTRPTMLRKLTQRSSQVAPMVSAADAKLRRSTDMHNLGKTGLSESRKGSEVR
jgi:serine/threonine protein kinase